MHLFIYLCSRTASYVTFLDDVLTIFVVFLFSICEHERNINHT